MFESTPNVLMVRKDSPFKTLKDFVDYAKKNPPGVVTVGGSGTSSANDLGTTMLGKAAGIKLTYVPFGGTGSAVPALLGNHVTALMSYSPMVVQYKDKFRFLAIASEKRMDVIPDVPTFREQGYDIVEGAYRGVAAPPGTPDAIIKILADAFDKTMKDPEVKKKMDQNGFKTEFMGPEASLALVKKKTVEYEAIMKELGRDQKVGDTGIAGPGTEAPPGFAWGRGLGIFRKGRNDDYADLRGQNRALRMPLPRPMHVGVVERQEGRPGKSHQHAGRIHHHGRRDPGARVCLEPAGRRHGNPLRPQGRLRAAADRRGRPRPRTPVAQAVQATADGGPPSGW